MFIQDEALGAMFRDTLLVFGGHRVNDKLVLPDLVFREEGDGTVGIEGGLMDLQQDRDAVVSFHFDEGSDNGDLRGPGGFWIMANQMSKAVGVPSHMGMLAKNTGVCSAI